MKENLSIADYEIMHGSDTVARISRTGKVVVYKEKFLPYGLYLEESQDIDDLVNNLINFYHWCAARMLSLDRQYAKEILNSIGVAQAVTDRDRAEISLSYHCVSLTDVYWVKMQNEDISYKDINLYDNPLSEAFVELLLRGKQMTVTNRELARDLSTRGCFPKAWIRGKEGFLLLKDGGEDAVKRELLASKICQSFYSYVTMDGANCQTVYSKRMTQKEAAEEAVRQIGLNQIQEVDPAIFGDEDEWREMFYKRLDALRQAI